MTRYVPNPSTTVGVIVKLAKQSQGSQRPILIISKVFKGWIYDVLIRPDVRRLQLRLTLN